MTAPSATPSVKPAVSPSHPSRPTASSAASSRPLVVAAVMASMAMIATEATIVSTATPQIVAQLGDLHLFSWVFSAFLLAQTAMTVVFGRLSDLVGRKPIMLAGVAVFTVGSVLVGFSWSMPSMIAFRLVQGIGAGAVQPVAMTIIADLYPAHERGKVQGWLASVWAISAVLGPLIGGLIIRNVSWAWIFWINVPVGLVAAAGFFLFLREPKVRQEGRIDVVGGLLFTVAISGLMVALSAAGTGGARTAWIAAAVFVASTAVFVAHERRAVDPMIDFALWSRRPIAAANGAGLIASMALMGLTSFLPMYVQGVLQRSPVVAGLALTMMLVGWPAGATVAARSFMRLGLQPLVRWGSCLLPLGALPFVLLSPGSSPFMAALGSLVMGFGMGLLSVSSMVLIQEIVPWSQRGTATASNIFARNLGSTLGATVLGTVLNFGLGHTRELGAVDASRLQRLLEASPDGLGSDAAVRLALHQSLHHTFWAMLAMSLLIVAVALRVPKVAIGRRADPSIAVDHSLQG